MIKKYSSFMVYFALTLGSFVSLIFPVPVISPVIHFISIVVLQGWLINQFIFNDVGVLHISLQIILIFFLGSLLAAVELWVLIALKMQVTENSVIIFGNSLSLILQIILLIKQRLINPAKHPNTDLIDLGSLAISIGLVVMIGFLVWYSIPVSQESYTELYVQGEKFVSPYYEGTLSIVNRENQDQTYVIKCLDGSNIFLDMTSVDMHQGAAAEIEYRSFITGKEESKLQIILYRAQDLNSYRTVEISGDSCKHISIIAFSVK